MLQLVPSHGSHGGHGGHDGHGGHVSHVGVGSGSEAPARSPKGVEITAPLRDPQKCFHSAHRRLKRVLNLDIVSPPQTREGRRCRLVRRRRRTGDQEVSPQWRRLVARRGRLGLQMGTGNKQLITEITKVTVCVRRISVGGFTETVIDDRSNNGIFLSDLSC